MNRALELLRAQLAAKKSLTLIGEEIGYSRTAVSLYRDGKYDRDSSRLEAALLRTYDTRQCPHLGEEVTPDVCVRKALSPKPFGGAARRAWWNACQRCPHHPEPGK